MEYEYSEQDVVNNNFAWLSLQTYDLWAKGRDLTYIKETLIPNATKEFKAGDEYYEGAVNFITQTHDLLCNEVERDKCILATKVLAMTLTLLLAKKVVNNKDRRACQVHASSLNELIRIGKSLGMFTEYVRVGRVDSNWNNSESLLIDETNSYDAKSSAKGGASIKSTLQLISAIELVLKLRMRNRKRIIARTLFVSLAAVSLIGIFFISS
jgi:hypothetical protein